MKLALPHIETTVYHVQRRRDGLSYDWHNVDLPRNTIDAANHLKEETMQNEGFLHNYRIVQQVTTLRVVEK